MNEPRALPFELKRLWLIQLLVSQTAQACPQCDRLARVPQIRTSGSLSRTLRSTPFRMQGPGFYIFVLLCPSPSPRTLSGDLGRWLVLSVPWGVPRGGV